MRLTTVAAALAAALALAAGAFAPARFERAGAYPEGPLVQGGRIYVAEMAADRVSVFEAGAWRTFFSAPECGPTSIAPFGEGFVVTCHIGRSLALVDAKGAAIGRVVDRSGGQPNDSTADGAGGVFFSSPGPFTKQARFGGAVMRLAPDGALHTAATGLWYPNGVFFDPAQPALYVSEHLARKIWRYPVLEDGALGPRALFADIDAIAPAPPTPPYPEAGPDGLERAPNGDMVVALYGEGRLLQIRPDGKLRRVIPTPLRFVTNIAFLPDGSAVVVGATDNAAPGLPGRILRLERARFDD